MKGMSKVSELATASKTFRHESGPFWRLLTAAEVAAGAAAVVLDLLVPTLVILVMAGVSLLARRSGLRSLGFARPPSALRLAAKMAAFATIWSLFQLGVTMPVASHVSGERQDLSAFRGLEGNVGMLVGLLVLSWTLAAVGEEVAYRGYLLTRVTQVVGGGRAGTVVGVLASSVLFGLGHTEQGLIGVCIVSLDAVAWSVLRLHYQTLWASVLAHGFNNTFGFVAFFLVGPTYGLW